ncbi:hypothetical protein IWX50DRAFT_17911 [Phyllosticta citricarpa]
MKMSLSHSSALEALEWKYSSAKREKKTPCPRGYARWRSNDVGDSLGAKNHPCTPHHIATAERELDPTPHTWKSTSGQTSCWCGTHGAAFMWPNTDSAVVLSPTSTPHIPAVAPLAHPLFACKFISDTHAIVANRPTFGRVMDWLRNKRGNIGSRLILDADQAHAIVRQRAWMAGLEARQEDLNASLSRKLVKPVSPSASAVYHHHEDAQTSLEPTAAFVADVFDSGQHER